MDDPKRLEPVVKLAEKHSNDAGYRLAAARNRQNADQQQLVQLQQYYAEYAKRLATDASSGMSVDQLRNYRTFLNNLGSAIEQKKLELQGSDKALEENRQDWVDKHQRNKALTDAQRQMLIRQQRRREKLDQKEVDDRAGAKHPP